MVFAGVSLLLCVTSGVLAFRGYFFLGQFVDPSMGNGIRDIDAPEPWFMTTWWADIPTLVVTILTVLPPIFATRAIQEGIRLHRIRRNVCSRCLYNLTGNTSGVCPECGVTVTGKVGE
jgi:hypothetical protein